METKENVVPVQVKSQEEMMQEILTYTRKTHNYIKWQMYITIVLVVIPLLATIFLIPFVLKGLTVYTSGLQGIQ